MWLMFGEGPMLSVPDKNRNSGSNQNQNPPDDSSNSKDLLGNTRENSEYYAQNVLNQPQNLTNGNIYQQLEENKKILELQLQIDKMKKNPRRVAQITVYYDDSTFETFVPAK